MVHHAWRKYNARCFEKNTASIDVIKLLLKICFLFLFRIYGYHLWFRVYFCIVQIYIYLVDIQGLYSYLCFQYLHFLPFCSIFDFSTLFLLNMTRVTFITVVFYFYDCSSSRLSNNLSFEVFAKVFRVCVPFSTVVTFYCLLSLTFLSLNIFKLCTFHCL